MMYICISRELARRNNFKILPKHPLSLENCQLYDYEEGFKRIDWDTMAKEFVENTLHIYGVEFPPPFVNVMPQWF